MPTPRLLLIHLPEEGLDAPDRVGCLLLMEEEAKAVDERVRGLQGEEALDDQVLAANQQEIERLAAEMRLAEGRKQGRAAELERLQGLLSGAEPYRQELAAIISAVSRHKGHK